MMHEHLFAVKSLFATSGSASLLPFLAGFFADAGFAAGVAAALNAELVKTAARDGFIAAERTTASTCGLAETVA